MRPFARLGASRLSPAFRLVGTAALGTTAVVHAWLYVHAGYRQIPTIGPSFVATVIAATVLGLLVLSYGGGFLVAAAGGFLLSVFGGYVLSATVGLFGFTETGQAIPAVIGGVAEVGGALLFGVGAIRAAAPVRQQPDRSSSRFAPVAKDVT
ncbi:MAG TPA: hypothetical protein VE990_17350 [Acidimicrobiales bacterium]|nr:hypothetical protein [Acidimicrobiales bacterium]